MSADVARHRSQSVPAEDGVVMPGNLRNGLVTHSENDSDDSSFADMFVS